MKLFAVISCFLLLATSQTGRTQQIVFKSYTMQDGLVANPVRRIFQDSKGFIWIATWEGLSKYDGHKFTNFNSSNGLSHPLVNDMYEEGGKLYVALNNGSVDVIEHDVIVQKLKLNAAINTFFFLKKNKKVLVSTDDGVYEFEKGGFIKPRQDFPHRGINELVELNDSLFLSITDTEVAMLTGDYRLLAKNR